MNLSGVERSHELQDVAIDDLPGHQDREPRRVRNHERSRYDIPAFIDLYRQGRLPVDRLVTRTLALEEINQAMDALAEARVLRQVITF